MDRRDVVKELKDILGEILEIIPGDIEEDSRLVQDLGVESIDLLELAVAINARFGIEVDEEMAFLKDMRLVVEKAGGKNQKALLSLRKRFSHISPSRIEEMLGDMDKGPVLRVKDVVDYIMWKSRR